MKSPISNPSLPGIIPGPPCLAFAYGRVSKRAMGANGLSPQELSVSLQDDDLRAYARQQQIPLDHLQVFLERHSGSFTFADIRMRKEGKKLIGAIRTARQQNPNAQIHLFFTKVDRVGRGWHETITLFRELREQLKVRLHIIELGGKNFDCDSMEGQLIISLLAWVAEMEVRNTQKRIRRALDGLREGEYVTGTLPYGFNAVETGETNGKGKPLRRLVDNPEEQKWIRVMFDLRRAGWSYGKIANHLNSHHVPTKRAKGTIMKLRAPGGEGKVESKFVTGKWQSGNVFHILDPKNKTVQTWLSGAAGSQQAAA